MIGATGEFFYHRIEYERIMDLVESEKMEHDSLLSKIIKFKSSSLVAYTNDYTYWDEMAVFANNGDTAWAHGNIDASLPTYGADYTWVFDSTFTLIYFTSLTGAPQIDSFTINKNVLSELNEGKRSKQFFIETGSFLIEISSYTIHYTADQKRLNKPKGYFAAGRVWSADYIKGITELTGTDLKYSGNDYPEISNEKDDYNFSAINEYITKGSEGQILTKIYFISEFTSLKDAYTQFRLQLIILNFIVGLVLLFSGFVLHQLVNKPLKKINEALLTGNSMYIQPLLTKKNEFGNLAKLINEFFEQKEQLLSEIRERIDAEYKMKISEEKLKNSVEEKIVLIKEVHHRVKNNLQIIISLIRLQAAKVSDETLHSNLDEILNRIKSIALVHEMLYRSKDLSHIEFSEYIKKITESLKIIYADKTHGININVCSDNVYFSVDKAVPCAIIINELVTNSIKHAFKNTNSGEINISLHRADKFYDMKISDNGCGLKKDFQFEKSDSLGMNLVDSLADQLDAKISIGLCCGTEFKFHFPVN